MALFRSNHKGFVQNVRKEIPKRHPASGDIIGIDQRRLAAEFGVFGAERTIINPETGASYVTADIAGGFYDSVAAQIQHGYTDDERDAIEAKLRWVAQERPDYVQEVVAVHVPAPAPWATYDGLSPEDSVELATRLGLVPETLRYERERLQRPAVIGPLEAALAELSAEDKGRAEPLAEVPADMLVAPTGGRVRIGRGPRTTASGVVADTEGLVLTPDAAGTIVL